MIENWKGKAIVSEKITNKMQNDGSNVKNESQREQIYNLLFCTKGNKATKKNEKK